LEVLVDDEDNRYSVAQSAAAIAIVSLACVGTVALAVPAVAAASGVAVGGAVGSAVGSAVIAGGSGLIAAGGTIITGFSAACATAGGFLAAHAGTAAKISAAFLPKAIDIVEKEVGGFNAVQKEVIQILSSPNVTEDVRTQGLSILSRLGAAVAADRAAEAEAAAKERASKPSTSEPSQALPPPPYTKEDPASSGSIHRPSLKRMQTSVSTLMHKLSTEGRDERKVVKREEKEAKETASWEVVDKDSGMLSSKEQLRIHGLFMNERRHFEVRERNGKLVLIDANTKEVVVG